MDSKLLEKHTLEYLIHHVILPPQLPQAIEHDRITQDYHLLCFIHQTLNDFVTQVPQISHEHQYAWGTVLRMLDSMVNLQKDSELHPDQLRKSLAALKVNDCIAFHIRAQNAGIIISRQSENTVIVDSFEASPLAAQVNKTVGRLVRSFPGLRVAVPWAKFSNLDFLREFSEYLHRLDSQYLSKESKEALEARAAPWDSQDPFLISEYLMTILTLNGERQTPRLLQKRTRDHALNETAKKPEMTWRRSPLWLVLRVALQTSIHRLFPNEKSQSQYKSFMLYVTTVIGNHAILSRIPVDVLRVLGSKLARGIYKAKCRGWDLEDCVCNEALSVLKQIDDYSKGVWLDAQSDEPVGVPSLQGIPVLDADYELLLTNSLSLLNEYKECHPDHQELRQLVRDMGGSAPGSQVFPSSPFTGNRKTRLLTLADHEAWTVNHLEEWLKPGRVTPQDCAKLCNRMQDYFACAKEEYDACPREISSTFLLVLETWTALDKHCIEQCPTHAKFLPGIPKNLLHPLLLPERQQLQRLRKIEEYLASRHKDASHQCNGLLEDENIHLYAAEFLKQNQQPENLRMKIEKLAQTKRDEKEQEWREKLREKEDTENVAAELEHEYEIVPGNDPTHRASCRRCKKFREAENLKIKTMRHPLPVDEKDLKTVLFELRCPRILHIWRDITWWIIQDLGRTNVVPTSAKESRNPPMLLENYKDLVSFVPGKGSSHPRDIYLASGSRGSTRLIPVPQSFDKVYLQNELHFQLFDTKRAIWICDQTQEPSLKDPCTLKLPEGEYSRLEWAFKTSQHSSNEVLANQIERSRNLDPNEYISFCELRAGQRTQWLNILVDLGDCHLSFEEESTCQLIFQTVWEAGSPHPTKKSTREAHEPLTDADFCFRLLGMLERNINTIRGGWNRHLKMMATVVLVKRILSVNINSEVTAKSVQLLREARQVTLDWTANLKSNARKTTNSKDGNDRELFLHRSALLCCFTYDVEEAHIGKLLDTDESVEILTYACILTQMTKPQTNTLPADIRRLLLWNFRSMHRLQPHLQRLVTQSTAGLDKAIGSVLNDVSFIAKWTISGQPGVKGRKGQWARAKAKARAHKKKDQVIDYDLLFGELYIDGVQLGKVPDEIAASPLFQRVFGKFYIGQKGGLPFIWAQFEEHTYEILPPEIFEKDLPDHFSKNFIHWLNIGSSVVEFRPLNNPWKSSKQNWILDFSMKFSGRMQIGSNRLLSPISHVGKLIAQILAPLESAQNIQIEQDEKGLLHAFLPRYDLRFHVNDRGMLECQHLNVEIDDKQGLGTWIGLETKLVVRDPIYHDCDFGRSVLIPVGDVTISREKNHVQIHISPLSNAQRRYVLYPVNRHLKQLDEPDKFSAFLKAYLHAITSFPEPDPFTGYSGTEMALRTLQKKYLLDTHPLDPETDKIREAISALTPRREISEQHVEHVLWNDNLSFLAQDELFRAITSMIREHSCKHSSLYSQHDDDLLVLQSESTIVHQRALSQNAFSRSSGSVSTKRGLDADRKYFSRDTQASIRLNRAHCVFETGHYLTNHPSQMELVKSLPRTVGNWPHVSQFSKQYSYYRMPELVTLEWGDAWGAIYDLCRKKEHSIYHLQFLFCAIAIGKYPTWNKDGPILRTCLAFAISDSFQQIEPPLGIENYRPGIGFHPESDILKQALSEARDEQKMLDILTRTKGRNLESRKKKQAADLDADLKELAVQICKWWLANKIMKPPSKAWQYLDVDKAFDSCRELWKKWQENALLLPYLREVDRELAKMRASKYEPPFQLVKFEGPNDGYEDEEMEEKNDDYGPVLVPNLVEILLMRDPSSIEYDPDDPCRTRPSQIRDNAQKSFPEVENLIGYLRSQTDTLGEQYAENLCSSLRSLKQQPKYKERKRIPFTRESLEEDIETMSHNYEVWFQAICGCLTFEDPHMKALDLAGLLPRKTFFALVDCLIEHDWAQNERLHGWKKNIINLASDMKQIQRCERLLRLHIREDSQKIMEEARNEGLDHKLYDQYPQWMLLEIENDFVIRKAQGDVALDMIERSRIPSGPNTVLQFPMGQGKSSVIIPMLAVALANGTQLVRIIVLQSLLHQSLEQLRQSLGGLLNRKLYYVPFSRQCRLETETIECLRAFYEECMHDRGVAIALPEQICSLKLLTQESQGRPQLEAAASLIKLDCWLEKNCCDILDESDEILDPRFQLIYPVEGSQLLDDSFERWSLMQKTLSRIDAHADNLKDEFPEAVEVARNDMSFPFVHISGEEAIHKLLSWIVEDVVNDRIDDLQLTSAQKVSVTSFIQTSAPVVDAIVDPLRDNLGNRRFKAILLFRGLIGHGLLLHALLQRRWGVNYGLDRRRCRMAVPYLARNWPSENSEYAHLDLRILLTLLSYYYEGLTFDGIRECILHPEASDSFNSWLRGSEGLTEQIPSIQSINFDNEEACRALENGFSKNRDFINFYLNHIVFPDEGKYYPRRLAASSWNIPAPAGCHPTIGFSGTNDNQYILPMNIEQKDQLSTSHVNAADLNKVLQPENRSYSVMRAADGHKLSNEEFFDLISSQGQRSHDGIRSRVSVLIDVGAQILDLQNADVARTWLQRFADADAEAVIFFDDSHKAKVLERNGCVTSLQSSPRRKQLDNCLIYLDEAHTRGIDLPIPTGTRAAVTLGPNLLHDRLVQACMRMRRLGNGHSIGFFSPPEVHSHILKVNRKSDAEMLTSEDIVRWSITNTLAKMRNAQPLRILQGFQHLEHDRLWREYLANGYGLTDPIDSKCALNFWQDIQEMEDQSLPALYLNRGSHLRELRSQSDHVLEHPLGQRLLEELDRIEALDIDPVSHDEIQEAEREISHEIQRQFHSEGPRKAKPLPHSVSKGLRQFIDKGMIDEKSSIVPAFEAFMRWGDADADYETAKAWMGIECTKRLCVTNDFLHSVQLSGGSPMDDFHRRVRYITTNLLAPKYAIVISQFEAGKLLPQFRLGPYARLHLYTPKITRSMMSFADLNAYIVAKDRNGACLDRPLLQNINLFSGALYLESFQDYINLCHFLGIATDQIRKTSDGKPFNNGEFVPAERRKLIGWPTECPFIQDPLPFLAHLLSIRHRGQDISRSHLGMLVRNKPVPIDNFDGRDSVSDFGRALVKKRVRSASKASKTNLNGEDGPPCKKVKRIGEHQDTMEASQGASSSPENQPEEDGLLFLPQPHEDRSEDGALSMHEENGDITMGEDWNEDEDVAMKEADGIDAAAKDCKAEETDED